MHLVMDIDPDPAGADRSKLSDGPDASATAAEVLAVKETVEIIDELEHHSDGESYSPGSDTSEDEVKHALYLYILRRIIHSGKQEAKIIVITGETNPGGNPATRKRVYEKGNVKQLHCRRFISNAHI